VIFCGVALTVRFSVLVNGAPCGYFGSSRGVRQGDPLSPFIFDLVMEVFSRMIGAITSRDLISGFSVGSRDQTRVVVSHLLFADDTLVFCGADVSQIRHIGALLVCFEAVSGLKVNLPKSALVLVGLVDDVEQLARLLGCGISSLPLKYLAAARCFFQAQSYVGRVGRVDGTAVGSLEKDVSFQGW
jgi:hypothetical protein